MAALSHTRGVSFLGAQPRLVCVRFLLSDSYLTPWTQTLWSIPVALEMISIARLMQAVMKDGHGTLYGLRFER